MQERKREGLSAQPAFLVLDYLYSKNAESAVAPHKPPLQKYQELARCLDSVLAECGRIATVDTARQLPLTTLFSMAEMIVYSLVKDEDMLVEVMAPDYRGPYLACHSLNVAYLSVKVGTTMGFGFHQLTEICVAALLHDIGMTRIHPAYFEHDRVLSEEERKVVETHPRLGHEFLKNIESDFPWLLRVILEEHQRGTSAKGYPAISEEEPHVYSSLIGMCDSFEALGHNRSFRKAYHPGDAIKIIIDGKASTYNRDILRAMIEAISIFPVGSLVQLNTNSIAEVIKAVEGSPLRPVVKVVDSQNSNRAETTPRIVNLSEETNLFITGLVYDERYYIPDQAKAF